MTSLRRAPKVWLLAASLLAASAPPAFAQSASPDQLKAAREVIELSGAASSLNDIVAVFFDEARQTFTRTQPDIAKDLNEVITAITPEFDKRREQLMGDLALVYAQRFSAQELSEIKGFYLSPTGRKLVSALPAIMQDNRRTTQAWSQKMSQDIVVRLRAEMKKRGHDL